MFLLKMDLYPNFAYSGRQLEMLYESFDEAYDRMCYFMGEHPADIVPVKRSLEESFSNGEILRRVTHESGIFSYKFKDCGTYSITET